MMSAASHDTLEIALFPLATVLFPEGLMPLRIFEQRYMDMAKACLKHDLPFGICLIEHGQEVGAPATPYMMGTLARISEWDMPQLGVLHVVARGGQSFLIRERWSEASGLQRALITLVPEESPRPLPDAFARLIPLLKRIYAEQGKNAYPLPHRLDDAAVFMTEGHGNLHEFVAFGIFVGMEVAAADGGGFNFDQDLAGLDFRFGNFQQFYGAGNSLSFHDRLRDKPSFVVLIIGVFEPLRCCGPERPAFPGR